MSTLNAGWKAAISSASHINVLKANEELQVFLRRAAPAAVFMLAGAVCSTGRSASWKRIFIFVNKQSWG